MPKPPRHIRDQRCAHSGRGAISNRGSRFQPLTRQFDDGLAQAAPASEVREVDARSIIARNNSPDVPFYQSINPYQGCELGCVYCYARPSHSYLDLSPGLDFETRIFYKPDAVSRLLEAWQKPSYECQPIAIGA